MSLDALAGLNIVLPKPTTDPEEFEVRVGDLIDSVTQSGGRRGADKQVLVAVTRYQAQCFALLLRESAPPTHVRDVLGES